MDTSIKSFVNLHWNAEDISCLFIVMAGYKGLYSLHYIFTAYIDARLDSSIVFQFGLGGFGSWLAFLFPTLESTESRLIEHIRKCSLRLDKGNAMGWVYCV